MSNTILTVQEITREAMKVLHSNCPVTRTLNHDYEKFGKGVGYDGQKIGPTLYIRDPIETTVGTTWNVNPQDTTETKHTLTVNVVRNVPMKFEESEMALSIDDFSARYIDPSAKRLAATVEAYNIDYMLDHIANITAVTSFAVPTTVDQYLDMRAKMVQSLCPVEDGVNLMVNPLAMRKIVNGLGGQYNPTGNISEMFRKGQMAEAAGFSWFEGQLIPGVTIGSQANSDTPVVGTWDSTDPDALPYSSATSAGTAVVGQPFCIQGVYEINAETKTSTGQLKQFIITAANTASGGAGTFAIYPDIILSGARQTCYYDGTDISGQSIYWQALDGTTAVSTTASATYKQNFAWHKDSFAFASAPLSMPKGVDQCYNVTVDNFNLRLLRDYDSTNARYISRLDIFFGIAYLRPEWACKMYTV